MDSPVFVEGTVSIREDEEPKILVNFMDMLIENSRYRKSETKTYQKGNAKESSSHGALSKLYLRVSDLKCKEYLKAKNIVDIFEGDVSVIFYDRQNASYVNYPSGIAATEYIISELRSILGDENVVGK